MNIVTVYDIQNKFIAYSAPMPGVVDVFSEWGTLYILAHDGKLYNLQEKDTQSKLDMLFKKNQYVLAISLAKSQQYDEDGLIDIFRQYGDHLYCKGDHDGAITQYIKTIGKLEASYVIRKFLDAQRIHNLTAYLQALHKKGLATEDHTTLLLNCYTKLKDNNKLDEFIMTKDREVDFDVEIAMKVCRQAGYYTHALYLAQKHEQHDWYLKIQLEDHKDYNKALDYIAKLDFYQAEENMKRYGKILMSQVPEPTTELLKKLCTDYKPSNAEGTFCSSTFLVDQNSLYGSGVVDNEINKSSPEEFIHIFVNNSKKLMEFLEMKVEPRSSSALVYNTLLELYLHNYNHETDESNKKECEQKIMDMLSNPEARYHVDQALVLCQMNSFKPGILHLYEKEKLYQQILAYHIEHKDYENVIKTCERFGNYDPMLWVQALWFFSQTTEDKFLMSVLSQIEKKKLLPPIMVVNIMSRSHTATLAAIKDYLIRYLQQENDRISENERLIRQYREETQKLRNQMEEMRTNARIFQVSKCSGCSHQLELPSVHFLCGHSYHQQ
ncbi:vacuolar protein sorting-associated protein 11 homolog [Limulus polyphemus]|uniref:Vacuolar protein sorting-associated protein 11 homolog n=1 Tax=Limulus polyphemus TaxID=6850 RepID=A0ABM1TD69_LIMPO|nr:vacuolar protein sorting-associated protein 11 homolog [Limulus polyphemus]